MENCTRNLLQLTSWYYIFNTQFKVTVIHSKILKESFHLRKWCCKWNANQADSNWLLLDCYYVIRFQTCYCFSFVALKWNAKCLKKSDISSTMSQFDTLYIMYPKYIFIIDQGSLSTQAHSILKWMWHFEVSSWATY